MQKCLKCKKNAGAEIIYGAATEADIPKVKKNFAIPGGFRLKNPKINKSLVVYTLTSLTLTLNWSKQGLADIYRV